MDGGAWRGAVYRVTRSQTRQSDFHLPHYHLVPLQSREPWGLPAPSLLPHFLTGARCIMWPKSFEAHQPSRLNPALGTATGGFAVSSSELVANSSNEKNPTS